ncbi:MAG: 1-acyl-sn-glycerol-3-phosphate acyltransferase [Clostridia bacterium]|nr:1-acyl-sn-glycerol-3-phosphate acyltransferase [Clostridia bacterium]
MNSNDKLTPKETPKKKTKKRNYFFFNFVKVTGSPIVLWMRPKVYCYGKTRPKDVKGGAIIAANHSSFYDPVFGYCVFWRRNMHCVATKDLFAGKWKDFFFRNVQCIKWTKRIFPCTVFTKFKKCLKTIS